VPDIVAVTETRSRLSPNRDIGDSALAEVGVGSPEIGPSHYAMGRQIGNAQPRTRNAGEVPRPMLKQELPHRRLRGLAAATMLAGLTLVPAGATMAVDTGTAEVGPNLTESVSAAATVDELRSLVEDLSLANDTLKADNNDLQARLEALAQERDRLSASLERFDDLYQPIESDRQLLFELRKQLPETRPEAEAQLARIRSLALSSDPQRLGQIVDRVDDATPAFLDWRFGQFDTTQDFSQAYVDTGANAFDSSFDELRSEALMTVANRLDGLLTILDRIR
jgi:hypothetical protein